MDPLHFILILAIGAVAGGVAGKVTQSGSLGFAGDLIVGVIGAGIAGLFLTDYLPFNGLINLFIGATLGAIVLLIGLRLIKRG